MGLVRATWAYKACIMGSSQMEVVCHKLKNLNLVVRRWEKEKNRRSIEELTEIDAKLLALSDPTVPGYFSVAHKSSSLDLEGRKREIFKYREEERWLKICAIWITRGDKCAKRFHNFSTNTRRENNTWELNDVSRNCISSLKDLHLEVVLHFGNLYRARDMVDIEKKKNSKSFSHIRFV